MHTCMYEFRTYIKRVFSFSQANSMGEWLFLFLLLFCVACFRFKLQRKNYAKWFISSLLVNISGSLSSYCTTNSAYKGCV